MTEIKTFLLALLFCAYGLSAQKKSNSKINLSNQDISIIKIASYTAQGDLEQLKDVLNEGLENGLTVNESKEILVHLYAYAGFPRSIRGLQTFLEVLDERKNKGIDDDWGRESSPIIDSRTEYERGEAILEKLVGRPLGEKPAYQKFSPEMDNFLKKHLFAAIFERDVLSHKQRELITISVIASLGSLEPMLKSHLTLSQNVGWQPDQLNEFVEVIKSTAGEKKANSVVLILNEMFESQKK